MKKGLKQTLVTISLCSYSFITQFFSCEISLKYTKWSSEAESKILGKKGDQDKSITSDLCLSKVL